MNLHLYSRDYCRTADYLETQAWLTERAGGRPTRTWEYAWALKQALAIEPEDRDATLDVGAWTTYFALGLLDYFRCVQACDDFSWAERPEVQGVASPAEWVAELEQHGIAAFQGSAADLPVPTHTFDVTFCLSTIEHVPDDQAALRELLRVTRYGGLVVVTTDLAPEPRPYHNYGRVYSPESLSDLVEAVTDAPLLLPEVDWHDTLFPDFTVGGFVLQK